jgi:hypothetical protein
MASRDLQFLREAIEAADHELLAALRRGIQSQEGNYTRFVELAVTSEPRVLGTYPSAEPERDARAL